MAEDIKNYPLVSVFKAVADTTPLEEIPILQALFKINNNSYRHLVEPLQKLYAQGNLDAYSEQKKKLPSFTPCGTFEGSRKADNCKKYSQYIILDIDKLKASEVVQTKKKISEIPFTFSCFVSPSGCGLKILVKVNCNVQEHLQAFNQLKAHYENILQIEIDKSGKDISRLCFFSSDNNIYINYQANTYLLQHTQPPTPTTAIVTPMVQPQNDLAIFQKCVQLTNNKIAYVEGNRNNYVHLLANNCNRNGLTQAAATQYIKAHYNYNEEEVSKSIYSAYNAHPQEHGKFTPQKKEHTPTKTNVTTGAVPIMQMIKKAQEEPPVNFVWSGIKQNSFGFIFGPSKSGKTTICENLALCLAAGITDFMGQPITQSNYKVLLISLEEYWTQRTERIGKQIQHLLNSTTNSKWTDNIAVVDEIFPREITTDEDWYLLEKTIKNNNANFVVIDSLSRLYQGTIEDSSLAKKVSLRLRELSYNLKITLVVIHHCPKQTGKPLTIDSLAGSRILAQEADFMIGIGKSPDGKRYIKDVAFRYKPEDTENVITFDIDNNQITHPGLTIPETVLLKETDGRQDDSNPQAVLDFIAEKTQSIQGETYTSELIQHFVDTKIISKATLYNALSKLENKGKISKQGKGIYKAIEL